MGFYPKYQGCREGDPVLVGREKDLFPLVERLVPRESQVEETNYIPLNVLQYCLSFFRRLKRIPSVQIPMSLTSSDLS